jgi:hypothetical protein
MEEEDNYEEDQRHMTANASDLNPNNAAQQAKQTPRSGNKVKTGDDLPGDIYQATNQPIDESQMSRMTNSYDQAIAMGYVPTITAVPPLISSEDLDRELFQLFDYQNTG